MLGMRLSSELRAAAFALGLFLCAPLSGCGDGDKPGAGTAKGFDDYAESPLDEGARRFQHALETSNAIVQRLQSNDVHGIFAEHFAPAFQQQVKEADFAGNVQKTEQLFGKVKGFKPMQWAFKTKLVDGVPQVDSSKIVEHERGLLRYTFTFLDDGKFEQVIGWDVRPRKAPGALAPAAK